MAEEQRSRVRLMEQGYELVDYKSPMADGTSFLDFLREDNCWFFRLTVASFFGVFGNMDLRMPIWLYLAYFILTASGVVLFFLCLLKRRPCRRNSLLAVTGAAACAICFALHVWHSYTRDYEPQGRYIITVALCLGFLTAQGMDTLQHRAGRTPQEAASLIAALVWLALFGCAAVTGMSQMYQ